LVYVVNHSCTIDVHVWLTQWQYAFLNTKAPAPAPDSANPLASDLFSGKYRVTITIADKNTKPSPLPTHNINKEEHRIMKLFRQ